MFDLIYGNNTQQLISKTITIIAILISVYLFLYFFSQFKPVQSLFYGIVFLALIASGVMSFGNLNVYYSAKGGVIGEITSIFEKNQVEITEEENEIKFDFSNVVLMKNAKGKYSASMTSETILRLDANESYFLYVNNEPCTTVKCEVKDIYATYSYLFMTRQDGEYQVLNDDTMTFYFALYDNYSYLYIEVENGEETAGLWNSYFNKNNFKATISKVQSTFYSDVDYKTISLMANNEQVNKITIKSNTDYILPSSLSLPGYRFNCWRDSAGNEITEIANVNNNLIITADLTKVCNVTIDADGTRTNYIVDAGTKIDRPANISKAGYTFKGWVIDGTETLINFDTFVVNDDVTIKAFFSRGQTIYSCVKDFTSIQDTYVHHLIRVLDDSLKSELKNGSYTEIKLQAEVKNSWYVKNDVEIDNLIILSSNQFIPVELTIKNGVMSSVKLRSEIKFQISGSDKIYVIPVEVDYDFSSYTIDQNNGFMEFHGYSQKVDLTNQFHQAYSGFADDLEFYISGQLSLQNYNVVIYKD